ncbi:MAM and LDL-receptor class A domain-containing 2-like, partial [Brachionus plicatilis]
YGSYGKYIYVESGSSGNKAVLTSQVFDRPTSMRGRCLTFWFYVSGVSTGTIETNIRTLVWKEGGYDNPSTDWNYGSFGFYIQNEYAIEIEGTSGSRQSSIGLDDLIIKDSQICSVSPASADPGTGLPIPTSTTTTTKVPLTTPIPSVYDCTFENDFCNWKNDFSLPMNWTRTKGKTSSIETGAEIDHTLGTSEGWFIYIETSVPAKNNDTARLESLALAGNPKISCLSFYYHMRGVHIDTLNVFIKSQSSGNESNIWSKTGNQGNKWFNGRNDPLGKFNWTRTSRNYYVTTGPNVDHTTSSANGHYMLFDAYSKLDGDKAGLVSPVFPFIPESYCLSWHYHMFGPEMGKLNIYLQAGDKKGLLWRFGENVGKIWNKGQLSINKILDYKNFTIIFEGERIQGARTLMALDDISLQVGVCPSFGSCTFEGEDYCFYTNVEDGRDEFDWEFGTYKTGSSLTGPTYDHTLGNPSGSYLFIEASSPIVTGNRAILESTLFLPTPTYGLCMDFWYHMYGSGMGTMNIYTNSSNVSTLIWSQSGNKGNVWLNGQVNINSASSFRVKIEAIRGNGITSDMAIDDLDFIERPCSTIPFNADPAYILTTKTTTTTTTTLKPSNPNDCNFEYNLCIWTPSKESNYNWTRT